MIFLTIAEDDHPNGAAGRLDVWLGNEDESDAARLGWLHPRGRIGEDFRVSWGIQLPDGSWHEPDADTPEEAVDRLRHIAGSTGVNNG